MARRAAIGPLASGEAVLRAAKAWAVISGRPGLMAAQTGVLAVAGVAACSIAVIDHKHRGVALRLGRGLRPGSIAAAPQHQRGGDEEKHVSFSMVQAVTLLRHVHRSLNVSQP